ncbi:hypothetical protein [Caproicibacterium lactatifermentans]|jgi:hypothetical protein|uniref:Phage tail protein n=2 Tax=Caproicibacterium TaxID=2834348 RepID=A0A859DQX8_9FIRM|nr:hypothetical protein [Caproicibacterium lactatifermentans]ARP49980.1 hypothetical protein B6259_03245 [Ruminococcaceae bacterium CPB6]QKN24298.1 hypothetical protein GJQ69_07220 [Caproicibacterium lactatifermentans]QKO30686.1 hypothetical protein GKP14_06580 [Caproicibacterium lactatifermentans]
MTQTISKMTGQSEIHASMVEFVPEDSTSPGFATETINKVSAEPQTKTTDAVSNECKGQILATIPETTTVTGTKLTLTGVTLLLDALPLLQGGAIEKDEDGTSFKSYTPPINGQVSGAAFTTNVYEAVMEGSNVMYYHKVSYLHCKGTPISINAEDNTFFAPEYTVNSTPGKDEAPYKITKVESLPVYN